MVEHAWGWNLAALFFMLPSQQAGIWSGVGALLCLVLPAITSFDWAQRHLGQAWRRIHLLAVPALILGMTHCLLIGARYFGTVQFSSDQQLRSIGLALVGLLILLLRCRWFWSLLSIERFYGSGVIRDGETGL
jgi:DMSO/TMAO reductase YedYZ heme-binding membrane subunit